MAIYEYRCDQDGLFEIARPLGTAPESAACCVCGGEARRAFSVAMVKLASRTAVFAAMDRAEKSCHEPDVVTALPSTGARSRTPELPLTPALRGLPRP
jgi:putative FmdB family regulatory protein